MVKTFHMLQLHLDACYRLTDATLYHLKQLAASLKYIGLSGTGITQVPQWGGDVEVVCNGCAIDSSGERKIYNV